MILGLLIITIKYKYEFVIICYILIWGDIAVITVMIMISFIVITKVCILTCRQYKLSLGKGKLLLFHQPCNSADDNSVELPKELVNDEDVVSNRNINNGDRIHFVNDRKRLKPSGCLDYLFIISYIREMNSYGPYRCDGWPMLKLPNYNTEDNNWY